MSELKIGDKVQEEGKYLGEIVKIETKCTQWYTIKARDTQGFRERYVQREAKEIELAPKPTSEEAWDRLPVLIVEQIEALKSYTRNGDYVLYSSDRSDIRHACYVVLGGAGVKVNEVKERVAKLVESLAVALGVRVV